MQQKHYTLLTCGTAGHVFPTLELAHQLIHEKNCFITLIIDTISGNKYMHFIEKFPKTNFKIILVAPFKLNLAMPFYFIQNIIKGWSIIRKTDGVIGFVAGMMIPLLALSVLFRKKIILHEQDSVLNKTNRIFLLFATKIFTSFKDVEHLPAMKQNWIGCPVKKKYLLSPSHSKTKSKMITILAGTNGSKMFDESLSEILVNLPEIKNHQIYHSCKKEDIPFLQKLYSKHGINANVSDFFSNFEELIAKSLFLITRSGASTISYLNLYEKNSILIPWKDSAHQHQEKNAKIIAASNGCIMIQEDQLDQVKPAILHMIHNPENHGINIHKVFKSIDSELYIKEIFKYIN